MAKQRYLILGGGISGLSLGWFLKRRYGYDIELTILEKSSHPGSWIHTVSKDGYLFEQGPRSFRPGGSGAAHLHLIETLNMQDEVIFADRSAANRYIYIDGKLCNLPFSPFSLLASSFTPKILAALWRDWRAPKGTLEDESIYSFISRRLGVPVEELIFDPMVSGIFAGNTKQLSLKSCFPWLYHLERKYGCITKGVFAERNEKSSEKQSPFVESSMHKGLFTLRQGVQSLTQTLAENLKENLHLNCAAEVLSFKDGVSVVKGSDGAEYIADRLFIAIPPPIFGNLIRSEYPELAKNLQEIRSTSLGVVNLGYDSPVLRYAGFGYLIPSSEYEGVMGVAWDSCAFPQQNTHPNQTRVSVIIGGAHFTDFDKQKDNALIDLAIEKFSKHLNISETPKCVLFKRATSAIPQYIVGHGERLRSIESEKEKIPAHIELLGSGFYGVSVNDCIERARSLSLNVYTK